MTCTARITASVYVAELEEQVWLSPLPGMVRTKRAASFWPRFGGQRGYRAGDMPSSFGIRNAQRSIGVHSCGSQTTAKVMTPCLGLP
jgi:hypothetical protein